MNRQFKKIENRRQLFTSALRYVALGVLGVVGGSVFAKRRRLVKDGICINRQICRSCGIFEECDLPPALSAKTKYRENK